MSTPADPWKQIAAFADGELNGEECCKILRAALDDPEQAKRVLHQEQLRKAVAGCMDCPTTLRCPEELRQQVAALLNETTATDPPQATHQHTPADAAPASNLAPAPLPFRPPSAARSALPWGLAAALAFALIGTFYAYTSTPSDQRQRVVVNQNAPTQTKPNASPAEVSLAAFTQRRYDTILARHVRCAAGHSRPMQSSDFPTDPQALQQKIADALGSPDQPLPLQLDLDQAGLTLRLAGKCSSPGPDAIHVLYDATDAQNQAPAGHVSLWIKPYVPGQDPPCEPGQTQTLAGPGQPHPGLLWRDDHRLYVLVGDAMSDVEKAKQQLTAHAI